MASGALFTIPSDKPFLTCLARAVLNGDLPRAGGDTPQLIDLPRMTILLPTRRAARALQEAFLVAGGGKAMLLPRIRAISEGDEDMALLLAPESISSMRGGADIPRAVSEIERRLVLTSLVQRWSEAMRSAAEQDALVPVATGAGTAAQAAQLAAELARIIDDIETENVSLDALKTIVPEHFSEHWKCTLDFLEILSGWWPAHLSERGLLSPADRRNRLVLAEAARIASDQSTDPIIIAGVTGSVPATAELMRAVAKHRAGAIVLPGLDLTLDADSWEAIAPGHPEHPQFGLARLLAALDCKREDVALLPGAASSATSATRARLVGEAMRPAATTAVWHAYTASADREAIRRSLEGVSLIEAPAAEDEAEAVALMMREVAETPKLTVALVTRDRLLARRVAVRLEAWGIRVDDSAGRPLAKTLPGAFLDLVIEAVATDFAPAATSALLKHPLTRLGLAPGAVRRAARAFELAVFRTLYLGRGLKGLLDGLELAEEEVRGRQRRERAVMRLWDEDWAAAHDLLQRFTTAMTPLAELMASQKKLTLAELCRAHAAAGEAIAAPLVEENADTALDDEEATSPLWIGEAGAAASQFFSELIDDELPPLAIRPNEYPDLYRSLVSGIAVRPAVPLHPRLSIWGPFEARLQQPDVVILGSLNETVWPEAVDTGAWLNRPMRGELGLPQPEARIGFSAHDFSTLLGAPRVIMTRAEKIDGVPSVASRWLLRLDAVLSGLDLRDALRPEKSWLAWAAARNAAGRSAPAKAPAPCPALALRPRKISVSDAETWIANPYALYARRILALEPLAMLGAEPGAALRGRVVHDALSQFAKAYADEVPENATAELSRFARSVLRDMAAHPRIAAFWLPRFERFFGWFAETEAKRRNGVTATLVEADGSTLIAAPGGAFTLTARADRIDVGTKGLVLYDYKTAGDSGVRRLAQRAASGEAPQLALEAAIALAGGFANIKAEDCQRISGLWLISASGAEPPGIEAQIKCEDAAVLAKSALSGLQRLIAAYDDPATPYRAVRRPRFTYDYDDYAHLARVAEWSGAGDDDGEEA